jgi:hypothetical protein
MAQFESGAAPEEIIRSEAPNPESSVESVERPLNETFAVEGANIAASQLAGMPDSGEDLFAATFEPHESVANLTDWTAVRSLLQQRVQESAEGEASRPEFLERLTNWERLEAMISEGSVEDSLAHESAPESLVVPDLGTGEIQESTLNYQLPVKYGKLISPDLMVPDQLLSPEMLELGTEALSDLYQRRREEVGQMIPAVQDRLSQIGISGRGENDLLQMFEERKGSYNDGGGTAGGSIMVWGIERARELSTEAVLNNLEEMGIRAINYTTLTNPTRMSQDPVPGGIVIVNPHYEMDIRNTPSMSALGREGELAMGETTIGLTPTNFDQTVEGVIPYEAFRAIAEERERLGEVMRSTYADQPEPNPDAWNAAYERKQVLERCAALLVAERMLERLNPA